MKELKIYHMHSRDSRVTKMSDIQISNVYMNAIW